MASATLTTKPRAVPVVAESESADGPGVSRVQTARSNKSVFIFYRPVFIKYKYI